MTVEIVLLLFVLHVCRSVVNPPILLRFVRMADKAALGFWVEIRRASFSAVELSYNIGLAL